MHTSGPHDCRNDDAPSRAGSRTRMGLVAYLLAGAAISGGCSEISGSHAPVESARLFTADGAEVTPLIEISDGEVLVVEARFYDAAGNELDLRYPEHATGIRLSPETLLYVAPVADEPFRRELSLRTPCVPGRGTLSVGYGHWNTDDERSFGPFEVQPTDQVASVQLFVSDSVQLTPDLKLPHGDTLRVQARFVGCDGEAFEVPADRELIFYWSDAALAEAVPVEGERYVYDLVSSAPVGATGQMSLGYGTAERPAVRVIGPHSVEVVEPATEPVEPAPSTVQREPR